MATLSCETNRQMYQLVNDLATGVCAKSPKHLVNTIKSESSNGKRGVYQSIRA